MGQSNDELLNMLEMVRKKSTFETQQYLANVGHIECPYPPTFPKIDIRQEFKKRLYKEWTHDRLNWQYVCEDGFTMSEEEYESLTGMKDLIRNKKIKATTSTEKSPSEMTNQELIESKLIDFLYADDSLISSRITVKNNRIEVNYYSDSKEDLKEIIPSFWKRLFRGQNFYHLLNEKNKLLHAEATAVARAKKLLTAPPPNEWKFY